MVGDVKRKLRVWAATLDYAYFLEQQEEVNK
jgi:hypothetical protein